jgi:hypothetical protein
MAHFYVAWQSSSVTTGLNLASLKVGQVPNKVIELRAILIGNFHVGSCDGGSTN